MSEPRNRLFVHELTSVGSVDDGDDPEAAIVLWKRKFSGEQRDKLAAKGQAMPDGSFPIVSVQDLQNAVQAIGRAKNPTAARRHIIKRAKALGRTDLLPDGWNVSKITDRPRTAPNTEGNRTMTVPDLSALEDELRAEIEKAFDDYETRITELETDEPVDVLKGLPDEAKARFEELEKKAADHAEALAKERDARVTVEWIGKAREFEKVLGDAEESAPHFKGMSDETAEWLIDKLRKVEAVLEKSDLFKELGSNDTASAAEQIAALVVEKQTQNPDLTDQQARVLVRKERPDLKALEREEGVQ